MFNRKILSFDCCKLGEFRLKTAAEYGTLACLSKATIGSMHSIFNGSESLALECRAFIELRL